MCDKNHRDEQLMLNGDPNQKDCTDQYKDEMKKSEIPKTASGEKKRVLFYWEEAIGNSGAWTPVCNLSLEDLVDFDGLDHEEEREVQFKMFLMTDEELDALPVE